MARIETYGERDAVGLAELVRSGEVTAEELLEEALCRVEEVNPELNAIVHLMEDRARETLARGVPVHAPFAGVPFLIKDLLADFEGEPLSRGSRYFTGYVSPHDSEVVRRFKAAGLVIFGKTNTPEFGLLPVTEPVLFGPCRNPWNPALTPGGSSGGSAAAVAARIVPMASGGDGGGSIRIPASCCGIFGLKPSRGRVPTGPDAGELWRGCAVEHVLTRSVRDSATMLDAISGPDAGATYTAPRPPRSFAGQLDRPPRRLRVAFTVRSLLGDAVDPVCVRAVEEAVSLLDELGHRVEEATPHLDGEEFRTAFMQMICVELRTDLAEAAALLARRPGAGDLEPATWAMALLGERVSGPAYAASLRVFDRTAREMGRFFETYDILVTPTLASPPVPIGALGLGPLERIAIEPIIRLKAGAVLERLGMLERAARDAFRYAAFTPVFNATGQPAMSVPLHWTDECIPIGVHFVGRYGAEGTLLRLARQLEVARPWAHRSPPNCEPES